MTRRAWWLVLLVLSLLTHLIATTEIREELYGDSNDGRRASDSTRQEVVVELRRPEPPQVVAPPKPPEPPPPPEEALEFEEEFELEPPEILIAPQAVTPPPPNVAVALKADDGGAGGGHPGAAQANATPQDAAGLARRAEIPTIGVLAPGSAASGTGGGTVDRGIGIGNALGNSNNQFAAYIAGLREAGLDVVFVVDATGSMGWVIDEVKRRISDIAATVRSLVPIARFGIVAYRDEGDPEFVTKVQALTYSTIKLQDYLRDLNAAGGGDIYEAVLEGMDKALEESDWRVGARRIVILIGDAPPDDKRVPAILRKVERFSATGGTVSTLDTSDQSNPAVVEAKVGRKVNRALYRDDSMYQFKHIADAGNGDSATLEGEATLTKRLIILIIGEQFAQELQALLDII